jgi:UDP-N-acetylmuramyl pentapeptide phosphotransferase/UDP-N-acetylglucosamine-1-phosphate transferase
MMLALPLLAFSVCYLILFWLLRHTGKGKLPMDTPNPRSLHTHPRPRIGGLGIMAGLVAATLAAPGAVTAPLLAGAFILALISAFDDWHGLPVWLRFPAHFIVAGSFLYLEGGATFPYALLALAGLVWATNLYNFMDGADGLAGGMAAIGFSAYAWAAWMGGAEELAALCLSAAAAAMAFLRFNFPPSRLFLGDAGSIPLGFLAAGTGWVGWRDGLWPALFPLLVFSPFIVDASATLLQRLWRREKVWQAHREHYYQRLVRMGWSHRKLAATEYLIMFAAAASSSMLSFYPALSWPLVFCWASFYALAMHWVNRRWRTAGYAA